MERLGIRCSHFIILAAVLSSCAGGFQGGVIPEKFKGVESVEAISPESIQITWSAQPGVTKYNLYSTESNSPILQPQFTTVVIKPNLATASSTKYSATAIDPTTGKEIGSKSNYVGPVTLFPRFNFKTSGNLQPLPTNATATTASLKVNWGGNAKTTYKVFLAEKSPEGIVNYGGFTSAAAVVAGQSSVTISNLKKGQFYCAVVVATYADNTNDGPDGTRYTTETSSTLNGWLVGTSGYFGDSKIAQSQICTRTDSELNIDLVRIYSQKAYLSTRPTFYVNEPGDTNEDNSGSIETSIYQINETTGIASFVGKRIGTGGIVATQSISPGRYKFYAIIKGLNGDSIGQLAKKQIVVGTETLEPNEGSEKYVYVRGFGDFEDPSIPKTQGYYPNKQQDGRGSQLLGSSVAMGDFDCDGRYDIAVGVPNAYEISADGRSSQTGKVLIYYGVDDSSPIDAAAPAPKTQTVTFDITSVAGNSARDLRLGTKLFVGNFNNDNNKTNQNNPTGVSEFQCHDLVIGSGYGPMFVLYGKRNLAGKNDGGLNYSSPTSFTINPGSSCDASTNLCTPSLYNFNNDYTTNLNVNYASGDFNGDGYEDFVTTAGGAVLVFRGSKYGLVPPMNPNDSGGTVNCELNNYPSGPLLGFPHIFSNSGCLPYTGASTGWSGTIQSVAAFPNAYYDKNGDGTGTKRIRDALVVAKNGTAFLCRPKTLTGSSATFSSDPNTDFDWVCGYNQNAKYANSVIAAPAGSSGFGSSMTSVKNALLYDPDSGIGDRNISSAANDISLGYPGAVVIGASSSRNAYVYYGVHNPDASGSNLTDRDSMGLARNNYLNKLVNYKRTQSYGGSDALTFVGDRPCKVVDGSGAEISTYVKQTTYYEKCDVQVLTPPGGGDWTSFGSLAYTLPASNTPNRIPKQSIIAMPAPNRSVATSGATYSSIGSVQLFYQDVQSPVNGFAITTNTNDGGCAICRYSSGFSTYLAGSIDYDGPSRSNIRFGAGGIAAGPIESAGAGATSYNTNNDIIVGAPGHVAISNGKTVVDNGGVEVYFSHSGTFRPYRIGGDSSSSSPWHLIDKSYSQESNISYHQVVSLGDMNQDGIDDVATRISLGSKNVIRFINGKNSTTGEAALDLNTINDFTVQNDYNAGIRLVPAGRVMSSSYQNLFITSTSDSYLFFGTLGGIINGLPSTFAQNGAPRRLSGGIGSLPFGNSSFYQNPDPTNTFARGDFNGDGFEDFAIAYPGTYTMNGDTVTGMSSNAGRVAIFYGGGSAGFQVAPDTSGVFPLNLTKFAPYSLDNNVVPGATCGSQTCTAACDANGTCNKIQFLYEGSGGNATANFGRSIVAIPSGTCGGVPVHSLAVSTGRGSSSRVYLYKPKCALQSTAACTPQSGCDKSGLVRDGTTNDTGTTNVIKHLSYIDPPSSSTGFGYNLAYVKGITGSTSNHLIVADNSSNIIYSYPILTNSDSTRSDLIVTTDKNTTAAALAKGYTVADYSLTSLSSSSGFADGLTDIGDINGDGFADLAISISNQTRTGSITSTNQGAVLILFGGTNGLQVRSNGSMIEPSQNPSCYIGLDIFGNKTSICNPSMLFAPQPYPANGITRTGSYEGVTLFRESHLNFGTINENLGSFMFGVPRRDSTDSDPKNRILSGGAFYVIP